MILNVYYLVKEASLRRLRMIPFILHSEKGETIQMVNRSVVARGSGGGRVEKVKHRGFFRVVKLFCMILQ